MMASLPTPVLIVGAGPTGLTLANALAAYGVPFVIVDQKTGPSSLSKGLALNMASQFGLELIGLGARVGHSGCRIRRLAIHWQGRKISAVDFRHLDFHLDAIITQPQSQTEQELLDALEATGVTVAWQQRLLAIQQSDDAVMATFEGSDGVRWCQRFSHAIGCEGKYSLIRQEIKAVFSGQDYPMHFVLGDFELRCNSGPQRVDYHVHEDTFFIIVPIGEKRWRVVVKHDGPAPSSDQLPDTREITDVVSRHMGPDFFASEAFWISRASFYTRTCDRMRDGRLFLAGDAAHLFSPIGGTGMNTGMLDALNLAWKLAYVLHGRAPASLLDSYEAERLESVLDTAATTDQGTRLIGRLERNADAIRHLLPRMHNRPALRSSLPRIHSGLTLRYTRAYAAATPGRCGTMCAPTARLRALLPLHGSGIQRYPLLLVAVPDSADAEHAVQLQSLSQLAERHADLLRCLVLTGTATAEADAAVAPPTVADSSLIQRCELSAGEAILVLPDGIIAWSGRLAEQDTLEEVLHTRFHTPPATRTAGAARRLEVSH